MATDATAQACKQNLQTYLAITNTITREDKSPVGSLLCTMNELLKMIVDSNFGRQSSLPYVGRLYEIIGTASTVAINESGLNLALHYFARSLAVVLEEAVCRLGGEEQSNQSSNEIRLPTTVVAAAVEVKPIQTMIAATTIPPRVEVRAPNPVAVKPSQMMLAGATTHAAVAPLYMKGTLPRRPVNQLDYSSEAVAGRINIWCIADTVKRQQLVDLLNPIDPYFDLIFPLDKAGQTRGFAYVKFKSNEKAIEALRRLKGTILNGSILKMEKAKFWFKDRPSDSFPTVCSVISDTVDVDRNRVMEPAKVSESWDSDDLDHVD